MVKAGTKFDPTLMDRHMHVGINTLDGWHESVF